MSFFDSPKNRAIWEREMRTLHAEKERRAMEGYKPEESLRREPQSMNTGNPFRKKISFQELVRQEELEKGAKKRNFRVKSFARVSEPEKQMQKGSML